MAPVDTFLRVGCGKVRHRYRFAPLMREAASGRRQCLYSTRRSDASFLMRLSQIHPYNVQHESQSRGPLAPAFAARATGAAPNGYAAVARAIASATSGKSCSIVRQLTKAARIPGRPNRDVGVRHAMPRSATS